MTGRAPRGLALIGGCDAIRAPNMPCKAEGHDLPTNGHGPPPPPIGVPGVVCPTLAAADKRLTSEAIFFRRGTPAADLGALGNASDLHDFVIDFILVELQRLSRNST